MREHEERFLMLTQLDGFDDLSRPLASHWSKLSMANYPRLGAHVVEKSRGGTKKEI